jgi:hypothetical protein
VPAGAALAMITKNIADIFGVNNQIGIKIQFNSILFN